MWAVVRRALARVAHAVGEFQTRLLLSIFYLVVMSPFALGLRLGSDPLSLGHRPGGSTWVSRASRRVSLDAARKQS